MTDISKHEKTLSILRRLGYFSLIIYPGILIAMGMSGDAGGIVLPIIAGLFALAYGMMPFICPRIARRKMNEGKIRLALVIAAIPVSVFVSYFLLLIGNLLKSGALSH